VEYVALESISSPKKTSGLEQRARNVFLVLGIIGILGTIVVTLMNTVLYMEYLRLYNLELQNWDEIMVPISLMQSLGISFVIVAMLVALGFYGVIDSSGGKYGLLFVFITLWPHSFNMYDVLDTLGLHSIDYNGVYFLDVVTSTLVAIIAGLILATSRHHIGRPKLLYFVILLMIADPIIFLLINIVSPGMAISAAQYLFTYSPGMLVLYTGLVSTFALFILEYRRAS